MPHAEGERAAGPTSSTARADVVDCAGTGGLTRPRRKTVAGHVLRCGPGSHQEVGLRALTRSIIYRTSKRTAEGVLEIAERPGHPKSPVDGQPDMFS